jgi:hypothetical protein
MSQELVNYKELTPEQLLALTGQQQVRTSFEDFPRVTINKLAEDDQERALPVGTYAISQGGKVVYGKPVLLRPFLNAYQYSIYDAATNTYPNRSIIFKHFGEEAVDELGGVACGKISKKKQEGLTPQQLEIQKQIKCYRLVYGLVNFKGSTADGEQVDVVNLPVRLRLSGDNFMPVQEAFDTLSKKKLSMLNYNLSLTTQRKKKGTNVYYQMVVELKDDYVTISKDDWATLGAFQESIDKENKAVIDRHHKARQGEVQAIEDKQTVIDLVADLNDDVSDIG